MHYQNALNYTVKTYVSHFVNCISTKKITNGKNDTKFSMRAVINMIFPRK